MLILEEDSLKRDWLVGSDYMPLVYITLKVRVYSIHYTGCDSKNLTLNKNACQRIVLIFLPFGHFIGKDGI